MTSRGDNFLISFGMKVAIIFRKLSVKVLTCQLGSEFRLRCLSQGKFIMLLLIATELALLKCQIFLSKGDSDGRVPLPRKRFTKIHGHTFHGKKVKRLVL